MKKQTMREKINLDNKISRNLPPLGNLYSNSSFHVNIDNKMPFLI